MTKPTVHMTTGLPGSGKSTFAKTLGLLRFNLDELRLAYGYDHDRKDLWTKLHENVAKEAMIDGAYTAVSQGMSIVLDNTFLTSSTPALIRARLQGKAIFKVHSFLDVPIEECIKRDLARGTKQNGYVGEEVIRMLAKRSSNARKNGWVLDDDWMNLWPDVKPAQMNPRGPFVWISDLDGTLALHVKRGPYELAKVETDALNVPLFELLLSQVQAGKKLILLSGRDEGEAREGTMRWLTKHRVPYEGLFMRPAGDTRPDYLVKYELFKRYVEPYYWVDGCFDDRDQCVALWRQFGLFCPQVNYGKF